MPRSPARPSRAAAAALLCWAAVLLCWAAPAAAAEEPATEGLLLVAAPSMPDPRFAETVILMVRHDATGALGLIVNRPVGRAPVAELLRGLGQDAAGIEGEIAIHDGGPVERNLGFVVHSTDYAAAGTMPAGPDLAVTSNPEVLRAIAEGRAPKRFLFVFGYAGWGPGQLEGEMAKGDWFTVPGEAGLVFGPDDARKWRRASERRGIDL